MAKENTALKSQLEKEKELSEKIRKELKPTHPDVIKIPIHECECGVTLRQRYIRCPVCGVKEPTKAEQKDEDEKVRLNKEQNRKIEKNKKTIIIKIST